MPFFSTTWGQMAAPENVPAHQLIETKENKIQTEKKKEIREKKVGIGLHIHPVHAVHRTGKGHEG